MGRRETAGDAETTKGKLVNEICFVSAAFSSCAHFGSDARKKVFVDWYLILNVAEDAGVDLIRRRYRRLALQLHPDKNKHPKAEDAFKLISEAYTCLSDKTRRKSFDGQRRSSFCTYCYLTHQSDRRKNPNDNENTRDNTDDERKPKSRPPIQPSQRSPISLKMKQLQSRFREECRVIENCLRVTMNRTESPLFDPSRFPNYPYQRVPRAPTMPPTVTSYRIRSDCRERSSSEPWFSQV